MRIKPLRICAVAIGAAAFTVGVTSTSAPAATQTSLHVTLHPVGESPVHIRPPDVYITDQMVEGGAVVGTLSYSLRPDGGYASSTRCDFHMNLGTLGRYDGTCAGTLMSGKLTGRGAGGATLSGTYALAPGGTRGLGPYDLGRTAGQPGS